MDMILRSIDRQRRSLEGTNDPAQIRVKIRPDFIRDQIGPTLRGKN
jgi:hypothetical protein